MSFPLPTDPFRRSQERAPLVWVSPWPTPALRPRPLRWRLNLLLFLVTTASVWATGGTNLVIGMLSILLAHEFGHFFAARAYGVDVTLPFFIPAPVLSLVGTLGAFIRIRSPIPHRRALFDIGIAGPLAGFVVCLPVLVLGVIEARVGPPATDPGTLSVAEPLLFQWVVRLLIGELPADSVLYVGAFGWAAWFGLFVTALNMLPIGQLDGGHVTYALLGRRALIVSRLGFWACVGLTYFGPNWLVWSLLLRLLGQRHPATLDDRAGLGRGRVALGILGYLVFVVCFVPSPFEWSWQDFFAAARELF